MKTIALFGGSFDPPHIGHVAIVEALTHLDYIDKIVIMPAFLNPFKLSSKAPSNIRLSWLKKIFKDFKKVEVSRYETDLQKKVSTIQTVHMLLKKYNKIYVVIGADNLASLPKWDKYEELKELVSFIVASRGTISIPSGCIELNINQNISSTELREEPNILQLPKLCAKEIYEFYKEKYAK